MSTLWESGRAGATIKIVCDDTEGASLGRACGRFLLGLGLLIGHGRGGWCVPRRSRGVFAEVGLWPVFAPKRRPAHHHRCIIRIIGALRSPNFFPEESLKLGTRWLALRSQYFDVPGLTNTGVGFLDTECGIPEL